METSLAENFQIKVFLWVRSMKVAMTRKNTDSIGSLSNQVGSMSRVLLSLPLSGASAPNFSRHYFIHSTHDYYISYFQKYVWFLLAHRAEYLGSDPPIDLVGTFLNLKFKLFDKGS